MKTITIEKSDIERLFNINIGKIINVETEYDSDNKNISGLVVRYCSVEEQSKYAIKYKHIEFGFIGEVNENDNHLHFEIESGDTIFSQSIPMMLVTNSKDWCILE